MRTRRLAIQVQLLAAGVYTVNEVRAMRGVGADFLSMGSGVQGSGVRQAGLWD